MFQFSSVQSLSRVRLFATPWIAARQASLSITNSREVTQTHVHRVSDAIQLSHPLSFLSPPAFSLSQHQGLFQWVSFSYQVAKVLEFQLQHQSFQWIFRTDFLKRSLVFPILLFSSIFSHWSLRKAFLFLLAILWNSVFRWVYLSFSPLPLSSLLSQLLFFLFLRNF